MIDQKTLEQIREKLGGDFHLVSLFQKRLRELSRGLAPLVNNASGDLWQTVIDEILQGKLQLATGGEAERMRRELEALPEAAVSVPPGSASAMARRRRHTPSPPPEHPAREAEQELKT